MNQRGDAAAGRESGIMAGKTFWWRHVPHTMAYGLKAGVGDDLNGTRGGARKWLRSSVRRGWGGSQVGDQLIAREVRDAAW